MIFTVTYPDSAFTSAPGGQINFIGLPQQVSANPSISDALVKVFISDYGTQVAESLSTTGRTIGFQFSGPGPGLGGGGQAALDALVAAHDGSHTVPDNPHSGGTGTEVWGWNNGVPGWVAAGGGGGSGDVIAGGATTQFHIPKWSSTDKTFQPSSGIVVDGSSITTFPFSVDVPSGTLTIGSGHVFITAGDIIMSSPTAAVGGVRMARAIRGDVDQPLGATADKIVVSKGTGGVTPKATTASVDPTLGTLRAVGASLNDPPFEGRASTRGMKYYISDASPVGAITHDPASNTMGVCDVVSGADTGRWYYSGSSSGSLEWYRYSAKFRSGCGASWASSTSITIANGTFTDADGRLHSFSAQTLTTGASGNVERLDTGSFATNTVYYIYIIRNNAGAYHTVCSINTVSPTLTNANFTTTGYVALARIGHFKTDITTATTIVEFYEADMGSHRWRTNDSDGNYILVSAVTATTNTATFGGKVPAYTVAAHVAVTTNGTAACLLCSASGQNAASTSYTSRVTTSQTTLAVSVWGLQGELYYRNSTTGGGTTINLKGYAYEDFNPL